MANEARNAICPCCGAGLRYDAEKGLHCDSCGNDFDESILQQMDAEMAEAQQPSEMGWQDEGNREWTDAEQQQLKSYSCPSCGAEIVADSTTAATQCVYCGNPSIMPGKLSGDFRPDAVIPFVKTKEDAQKALKKSMEGKRLLPDDFLKNHKIEAVTGVYVPFWLFDCGAEAKVRYRAERMHTATMGDTDVITTEHFMVIRDGVMGFERIPVDGSSKFDDTLMEAIEPFDMGKMVPFQSGYLPGYQAERYDVESSGAKGRADERVKSSVESEFAATVKGYVNVRAESTNIRLEGGTVKNVLFPVWMLNTKWGDKTYTFAMNGQTGKFIGDLPISSGKAWKWRIGLFAGGFAAVFAAVLGLLAAGVM